MKKNCFSSGQSYSMEENLHLNSRLGYYDWSIRLYLVCRAVNH